MVTQNAVIQRLLKNSLPRALHDVMQVKPSPSVMMRHPNTISNFRSRRPPKFVKGVAHDGNYYRVKIPPRKQSPLPNLPKIPKMAPNQVAPKPLTPPPAPPATMAEMKGYKRRLWDWLKANFPIMILNVGSLCTLVAFTRSDVLELRSLAMTGNLLFIVYTFKQKTVLWPPIVWSGLFAAVNGWKIAGIWDERRGSVSMSPKEEAAFVEHFMPHGITPRQFQRICEKANIFRLKKGECLIRKGDEMDYVYLIAKGSTTAHILGRRITAASTGPDLRKEPKEGGDSGAWAGEMSFLNAYWEKEQGKQRTIKDVALYTIVAKEDCEVLAWSHDDMIELMESSTDMRSALTRAMSLAVVGKVVNLTVSRTHQSAPWSTWLKDWKSESGTTNVEVRNVQDMKLAEDQT